MAAALSSSASKNSSTFIRMQNCVTVRTFLALMLVIIGIQGAYLGYTVGSLTSIERRFELSSKRSGSLLSAYDIGHTVAVLFVGYFGTKGHKPRYTATGVLLSSLAMFSIALPVLLFGTMTHDELHMYDHDKYIQDNQCDRTRWQEGEKDMCSQQRREHIGAYVVLFVGQLLAGISAAPFNTLAYVYIDDNLVDKQLTPFYLGLLTSMYAFGPALGFGLSSLTTRIYTSPGNAPEGLTINGPHWVGAWWIGYLVFGALYLCVAAPLLLFPKDMVNESDHDTHEMQPLQNGHASDGETTDPDDQAGTCDKITGTLKAFLWTIGHLARNPTFVSMALGWVFASYLVGGFATYLPKYIETQYGRSASAADLYAGIISIGGVATSTALGGYLLTKFNIGPRSATLLLTVGWLVIVATHVVGIFIGCKQPQLAGEALIDGSWTYDRACNIECQCSASSFEPVCDQLETLTYYSPCYAGCKWNYEMGQWYDCSCLDRRTADLGVCPVDCGRLPAYIALTFIGLFVGNMFFMTTMMVVLRCVFDEQKAMALSLASCVTNIFGFIPSPVIFGSLIDSACSVWHSNCPDDAGNCIIYDNGDFSRKFHGGNGVFQLLAAVAAFVCYVFLRFGKLPEERQLGDEN